MGGERQHYIPRFLLKGFANRTSKEKVFVWYFRKSVDPKEVSIRDIALEKNFYGEPGVDSLDQTLTDKESDFAKVVIKARDGLRLCDEDLDILIQFVQDLIIRTRHVRSGFTDGLNKVTNMFSDNISDADKVKTLFKNKELKDHLRKDLKKRLRTKNTKIIDAQISKLENNPMLLGQMGKLFAALLNMIDIPKEIEAAHKKAITRIYDEQSTKRMEEYRKLDWTIKCYEENVFILGDICVIQLNTKTGKFSIPIAGRSDENVIILPISHDKLVVGSVRDDISLPSTENINKAIAELSMDFIISSTNGEKEREYNQIIGNRAEYIDNQTLDKLEREHFKII